MSRRGDRWDNAPLQSFFATLKEELLRGPSFVTRLQARVAIFHSTEGFHNSWCLHSALGYRASAEVESVVRVSPPPRSDSSEAGTLPSSSG